MTDRILSCITCLLSIALYIKFDCAYAADLFQPDIPAALVDRVDAARDEQKLGRLAEAENDLLQLLKEKPDYYRAWLNLGIIYQDEGKGEQAIHSLETALAVRNKFNVHDTRVYNSLGWSYLNAGKLADAERLLLQAWKVRDDADSDENQRILNNLGYLYLQKEDFAKAREFVKRSQDMYKSAGASTVLGLIEESERRRARQIREAINRNPAEHNQLVEDNTKPRLFFFVLNEAQQENVWRLAPRFLGRGLYVTNVIRNAGKIPDKTEVRYFRDEDKEEAERLDAYLGELEITQHRSSRVVDPESVGTGRKFQVWLRSEDLR